MRRYEHQHTRDWNANVDQADAFLIVLPEYNYGYTAPLKNAIDYQHHEWAYKPVEPQTPAPVGPAICETTTLGGTGESMTSGRARLRRPEAPQRATFLELFFDLAFVFALFAGPVPLIQPAPPAGHPGPRVAPCDFGCRAAEPDACGGWLAATVNGS